MVDFDCGRTVWVDIKTSWVCGFGSVVVGCSVRRVVTTGSMIFVPIGTNVLKLAVGRVTVMGGVGLGVGVSDGVGVGVGDGVGVGVGDGVGVGLGMGAASSTVRI